ncbi:MULTISPECIES: histidine kinase [unclassified Plantibacter]|jgi:signal transduction histidine kinase|uniref:sensor histidine kinase n=1 Tax=unclassified Plantibacter TaxID=2624265 RepID=UPI003D342B8B
MTADQILPRRDTTPSEEDLLLPKPPGVIRQWWARHPWVADSIIAGVYCFVTMLGTLASTALVFDDGTMAPLTPYRVVISIVAVLVTTAAVLFRRHRPVLMLGVSLVMGVIAAAPDGGFDILAMPILLYSIAVYRSAKDGWLAFAGTVVFIVISPFLPWAGIMGSGGAYQSIIGLTGLGLFGLLIGINIGNRKRYVAALVDRAAQLARERDQQAQLAAAGERTRIAREMHDIVSHSLTVIVALSEGAVATKNQDSARVAMNAVAQAARTSLTDMRRMLGVLREEGNAPLTPQPDAEAIPALVETFRTTGLPARLTTTGPATEDPSVQLAVYRIVQEGLTNALRYSEQPTRVDVSITNRGAEIEVIVENDGAIADAPSVGAGQGLIGLRERVAFQGGSVAAGPVGNRTWRVHATLPSAARP